MELIDFHNHHIPLRFEQDVLRASPASQRPRWEVLARRLSDEELLLRDIREGDINARVVNMSPALMANADGHVPHDTIVAMNDDLAALAARHPGRIHGLASVDAYDGERSAREAERAICDLGLRGLFVDCARGDLMIDAPQARPTLEVAANLGVPILVHPVAPQPLTRRMTSYGSVGSLFARGTANSAALIALVEGEVFSELPGLRVVVTSLALGGIAMIAGLSRQSLERVYMDTNICHPVLLRAAIDLLGAENVLAGTDWPINDGPIRSRLTAAMRAARLSDAEQELVAAGNCRRLLRIS
ncbi:MAG TPA: amidohydrolase family protein [Burkholderiales bacterium]